MLGDKHIHRPDGWAIILTAKELIGLVTVESDSPIIYFWGILWNYLSDAERELIIQHEKDEQTLILSGIPRSEAHNQTFFPKLEILIQKILTQFPNSLPFL